MSEDRIQGAARQMFGRVQDAAGGLVGDGKTQLHGKLNQAAGSAQDAYGQVKDRAGDVMDQVQDLYDQVEAFAREQPLAAVAGAAGIGIVLGLLLRSGGRTVYVRK